MVGVQDMGRGPMAMKLLDAEAFRLEGPGGKS